MNKELYFCLRLTESEHGFVENDIKVYCDDNNLELKYYRKLKEGHIPLFREVKVSGEQFNINKFKEWARKDIFDYIEQNPHKLINN